jgi:hypothetical protein
MLIERLATRLELAKSGGAPLAWSAFERERRIILDIADAVDKVIEGEPKNVAEHLRELSFWIWSLCRHPHWEKDVSRDLFLEMLSMETDQLGTCTGLSSIGIALGGDWPVPWPDLRDETDETPLLELFERDESRLVGLACGVREDNHVTNRLRDVAARLRRAVEQVT